MRKVKGEGPEFLNAGYVIDRKGISRGARGATFVCKWGRKAAGVSRAFLSSFLTPRAPNSPPVGLPGTRIRALYLGRIAKVEILLTRWTAPSAALSQANSRDKEHAPIERTASDAF